jgi:hypothetical protein
MDLLRVIWAFRSNPRTLLTVLRVLAWPPSRIRYDRARLGDVGDVCKKSS